MARKGYSLPRRLIYVAGKQFVATVLGLQSAKID